MECRIKSWRAPPTRPTIYSSALFLDDRPSSWIPRRRLAAVTFPANLSNVNSALKGNDQWNGIRHGARLRAWPASKSAFSATRTPNGGISSPTHGSACRSPRAWRRRARGVTFNWTFTARRPAAGQPGQRDELFHRGGRRRQRLPPNTGNLSPGRLDFHLRRHEPARRDHQT